MPHRPVGKKEAPSKPVPAEPERMHATSEFEYRILEAAQAGATALDLSHLHVTHLPESLGQLTQLESLHLRYNELTSLPDWLGQLTQLQSLDLGNNELTSLPDWLGQLTQLQYLDLGYNGLTTLPESLGRLRTLRTLLLHGNRLAGLPDWVGGFSALRLLSLSDNPLSSLPAALATVRNLRALAIGKTDIHVLPESVGKLENLEYLVANGGSLERLPEWIGRLRSLRGLDVSNTEDFVVYWDGHHTMWRSSTSNRASDRPGHPLGLEGAIPESIRQLSALRELYLHGNEALEIPAEILGPTWRQTKTNEGGPQNLKPAAPTQILDYYFRARKGSRRLNEAKLILVGRGGVGKTCLIKRLIHDSFDEREPETPGIEIQPWQVTLPDGDEVRLHVWDFGGQEILHATHQFFLTERTLYLLVLSGREGNPTQDAEYWLQLIRSFGGNSPVLIALNKSALHPFDVNRGLLLEKYPFIADFVKTECGDPVVGVPELKRLVLEQTAALEHRKADFPSDWFSIKERLAGMEDNFVSWERYQEICREQGEADAQAQRDLARFLHILGIALNYADDPRLYDTRVLKPRWVTDGIYAVLRSPELHARGGVLHPKDLTDALDACSYPVAKHDFLLRLMENFQLCFRLPSKVERYLVPELLGENQPDIKKLLQSRGLGFRYQYQVLPEGLLPRFIVQTHALSEGNPHRRWRTGVVLQRDGCHAIVRADARERRVDIHITGPQTQRRGILAIIREKFDEQHRDLKGLAVDERVPIPGHPGVMVSYRDLLKREERGESTFYPENMDSPVSVQELLNGVESRESRVLRRDQERSTRLETDMSKKNVFLSYCHHNQAEVKRLHDDLIAAGEAVWWDQDILGGQDWKFEIRRAMKNSFAVVLCLSQESQARKTTGIYPEALDAIEAYRLYSPGSIFLIPVRLSDCEIPDLEIDGTRTLDRLQHVDLFPASHRAEGLNRLVHAIRGATNHP